MKKHTIHFIRRSVIGIFIFFIILFGWMIRFMLSQNEEAMREICLTYTAEMSHQLANHFASVVDLRLSMTKGIIGLTPPDSFQEYGDELIEKLTQGGQNRYYTYLALVSEDGDIDVIYGDPLSIREFNGFCADIAENGQRVGTGEPASREMQMLFGVKAAYPMSDGGKSLALVAGLPVEYVNSMIELEDEKTLVYLHVIRKDGSYVIQNPNNHFDNYMDWLAEGLSYDGYTNQEVIDGVKETFAEGETYSFLASADGQKRMVFFEPLKDSNWYLVTVLMYGTLDTTVADLGKSHIFAAVLSCAMVLMTLFVIFLFYMRMTNNQLTELEKERQRADDANRAKSDFLSNMSHDIRTPMNGILGMTAIAVANIDNREMLQDALHKIMLSGRHLLGLINNVLDMSKIEAGKMTLNCEQIPLHELMENLVNIIRPQIKSNRQKFDIFLKDIQCENIYSDRVRLNQILINIVSNAMKYTPAGGAIYVTLSQEDSPKGEGYVRNHIWVKDSGLGMTEEFQAKLFESFAREDNQRIKKIEGSGLGLAITKYIVDAMEGTIEVESEVNKGTTFHIALDFQKAQILEADMTLPPWNLLLVDDDIEICESASKSLEETGVHVEWALSGEEAVRMTEERNRENKGYHVVLLDWQMPGMNGIETAREIRKRLGEMVPIILISAYDWGDIQQEAKEAGIDGFICKPLFKTTLYHGLAKYVPEEEQEKTFAKRNSQSDSKPELDFTGKRLLVAEDYDMNWEICNQLLSAYGFELEWAENGQICVDKFSNSEKGFYDAILMDLRMPVMNGYEATARIRAMNREDSNLPIIAMTADAFAEDIQRCLDCGMDTHVAKPIEMKGLLAILKSYLL